MDLSCHLPQLRTEEFTYITTMTNLFSLSLFLAGLTALSAADDSSKIQSLDEGQLPHLAVKHEHFIVTFVEAESGCSACHEALQVLEDVAKSGIPVYKTSNSREIQTYAIYHFPAFLYFRHKQPVLYTDGIQDSAVVQKWIASVSEQLTVSITPDTLHDYTTNSLIYFYKENCPDIRGTMEAVAHKFLKDRGDLSVCSVNLDEHPYLAQPMGISKCPELLLINKGSIDRYSSELFTIQDILHFVTMSSNEATSQTKEPVPALPRPSFLSTITNTIKNKLLVPIASLNLYIKVAILLGVLSLVTCVVCAVVSMRKKTESPHPTHIHYE